MSVLLQDAPFSDVDIGNRPCSIIVMFRPKDFCSNPGTKESNLYQNEIDSLTAEEISEIVKAEHKQERDILRGKNIPFLCLEGPEGKPDAIFPNNSIIIRTVTGPVTGEKVKKAVLCPMSEGRRGEITDAQIEALKEALGADNVLDLRYLEKEGIVCEGTGVINFHWNRAAFVNRSCRANDDATTRRICKFFGIDEVIFYSAFDENGNEVYHSNVVQWIANGDKNDKKGLMAMCLDVVPDEAEKQTIRDYCTRMEMKLLELTADQVKRMAGNCLVIDTIDENGNHVPQLIMEQQAKDALYENPANKEILEDYFGAENLIVALKQIENLSQVPEMVKKGLPTASLLAFAGGGGPRCTILRINTTYAQAIKTYAAMHSAFSSRGLLIDHHMPQHFVQAHQAMTGHFSQQSQCA